MQSLLDDTWSQIQTALRDRAGDAAYDAWLAELKPVALERGICYVEAKNRLVSERVQNLYETVIADCLSQGFGTRVDISVVTSPPELDADQLEVGPSRPVVDSANRTGFLLVRALVEGRELPSRTCLFHGAAGTGKSYFLRWYVQHVRKRKEHPERPREFQGEALIKAFQVCLKERRVLGLRGELAGARPLVIDELHRVAGHARIQQEIAKVISERAARGYVTLMASRHHPRELWRSEEKLISELLAGLVVDLGLPGPAARLQYLRALEGPPSRNGRAGDIERLARDLHGSYTALRKAWLAHRYGSTRRNRYLELIDPRTTFDRTVQRVARRLDVAESALASKSQERRVSFARQVIAWLCVQQGLSRAEVGRFFGGRSRAAISYATRTLEQRMREEDDVRAVVEGLL